MLKQHLAVALLGTALFTLPALAQTSPGTSSSGNQPAASGSMNQSGTMSQSGTKAQSPAASQSQGSDRQASTASAQSGKVQFLSQAQPGQWRASKLVGVDVYGQGDEKIGDINDVLLDHNGDAQAVVIGVGGFLGIGEKDVAVPFDALQWSSQPRSASATGANRNDNSSTTGAAGSGNTGSVNANAQNREAPDHAVLSMSKQQLQDAPSFKYGSEQK